MKFPRQPIILLWTLVGLLLAVMVWRAIWFREDTRHRAHEQAQAVARLAAEYAQAELRAIDLTLLAAADVLDRGEWHQAMPAPRREQVRVALTDRMQRSGQIETLAIFDEADRLIAGSGPHELLDRMALGAMFRERAVGKAEMQISDTVFDAASGRWMLYVARGVTDEKGEPHGVVMAAVAMNEHFVAFYASLGLPAATAFSLWRRDTGRLVMRHPMLPAEIGQVNRSRTTNEFVADATAIERVDEIISPLDQRPRMVAVRKLRSYPFYMIVALDESDYMEPWRVARPGWALQLVVVFLVGVAGHLLLRRLDRHHVETRLATAVFQQAREGFVVTRSSGEIVDVNAAFCAMTGYPREELIGGNPRMLQSGRQGAEFYRTLWATLAEQGQWSGELWNKRRDGTHYIQFNTISALRDRAGTVTHYLGIGLDVTQRKEDEMALMRHRDHLADLVQAQVADLRAAKEQAERANRAKSEFVANMSHELRTPLHAILGFAELGKVLVKSNAQRAGDYFGMIGQSGERLLKLLNDLLDLSKLEAGRLLATFAPIRLDVVVDGVIFELRAEAARRQIALHSPGGDWALDGDAARLGQVVGNLVRNAIRYSPDGGDVHIEIGEDSLPAGRRLNDTLRVPALRLTVSDRGPGVPESEIEAIFDKFVQSTRTRDGSGGTGLGLSICREIVALHGGRIGMHNRDGGGSVFEVLLPRQQVARHGEDDGENTGG